jgi:hypothetical protein
MKPRSEFGVAVLVSLLSAAACGAGAGSQGTIKFADNIRADLVANQKQAIVTVRSLKPEADAVSNVTFSANGRPIASQWIPFPAPGQSSEVVALLDVGDPNRAIQIRDNKSMMLLVGATRKQYQHYAFGTYGASAALLAPASGNPQELAAMIAMAAPLTEPSNLSAALLSTIASIEPTNKEDRRAVLVFTDGHNDSAVSIERVMNAARAADVAISFVLSSSSRAVDVPVLARLAENTGGNLVSAERSDSFLRNPLQTVETGGTALASIEQSRKFIWDHDSYVTASISYGPKTLTLTTPAVFSDASIMETAQYLARDSNARVLAATATAAIGLLICFVLPFRRWRKTDEYELDGRPQRSGPPVLDRTGDDDRQKPPQPIVAILESETGVAYPVQSPITHIGRSTENEVIISDPAVSRLHAIMRRQSSGQYSIENRSDNGTFVNDQSIEVADLVEGDLIKIGSVTLRYLPV